MIKKLIKGLNSYLEKRTVRKYVYFGMVYGDMLSYWYMGKSLGFDRVERKFKHWQKKYEELGYQKIEVDDWVTAGGYRGESHILPLLRKKINNTAKNS